MTIADAEALLISKFGKRGIHVSTSDHDMTVSIEKTDISRFEIDGHLAQLAKYGVYPNGTWFEELFFKDSINEK